MQLTPTTWNKNKSPSKNRSPCKENQSPIRPLQKPFNQSQLIDKFCSHLKEYGINVPTEALGKMKELN